MVDYKQIKLVRVRSIPGERFNCFAMIVFERHFLGAWHETLFGRAQRFPPTMWNHTLEQWVISYSREYVWWYLIGRVTYRGMLWAGYSAAGEEIIKAWEIDDWLDQMILNYIAPDDIGKGPPEVYLTRPCYELYARGLGHAEAYSVFSEAQTGLFQSYDDFFFPQEIESWFQFECRRVERELSQRLMRACPIFEVTTKIPADLMALEYQRSWKRLLDSINPNAVSQKKVV